MARKTKLEVSREKAKALHNSIVELETRAGIAEKAKAIRSELANYFWVPDAAERWSDEQSRLEGSEEAFHAERTTRRIRELYFSITDIKLRKQLIAKDREVEDFTANYYQQNLADASARLATARQARKNYWFWASVWGVLLIGVGVYFFGLFGAMAGLLAAYFNARRMEHEIAAVRESATTEAERELKEAEVIWNKIRNEPQTFSRREATRGLPDPEPVFRGSPRRVDKA